MQDVIGTDCHERNDSDAQNPIYVYYYTLLHITAYITVTFIEPCMLARIMDNQVWFEAYLRDTSGKGGSVRFAHHLHPGKAACDSGWRYWDHPVRLSQWLSQRRPSLQPRPCQC